MALLTSATRDKACGRFPKQPSRARALLLCEKAEVVPDGEEAFEEAQQRILLNHSRRAHSASPQQRLRAQTNLLRAEQPVGEPLVADPRRDVGPAPWGVFAEWTT
jgi:hypothetical protein